MDGGTVVFLLVLLAVVVKAIQAHSKHAEQQKVEDLKTSNPQLYSQIKQMEHDQKMMEHEEKLMRHENIQTGANIFRNFFR